VWRVRTFHLPTSEPSRKISMLKVGINISVPIGTCTVFCIVVVVLPIPPGAWMFVPCECCVLLSRSLCVAVVIRPEGPYRVCCVQWVWSQSPIRGGHDPESGRNVTREECDTRNYLYSGTREKMLGKHCANYDTFRENLSGSCRYRLYYCNLAFICP
jgi:hypothetical protein